MPTQVYHVKVVWVVGGDERSTDKHFFVVRVANGNAETIKHPIYEHVGIWINYHHSLLTEYDQLDGDSIIRIKNQSFLPLLESDCRDAHQANRVNRGSSEIRQYNKKRPLRHIC